MQTLNRVLPLGRKYYYLLKLLNSRRGWFQVGFGRYTMVQPAAWPKETASLLLMGTNVVPDFALLGPVCRELNRGCIVDVGANIGLYTLLLRSVTALPILAFEPQPLLFQLLKWNIASNHLAGVEARNVACGDAPGELPFYLGPNGSVALEQPNADRSSANAGNWDKHARFIRHHKQIVKVPVTRLDEELADVPDVALIKIDCEGFEYRILQGAQRLLARHRPFLLVEIHPGELLKFGASARVVVELLQPSHDCEFWCFERARHTRWKRKLVRFLPPQAYRYPDAGAMLEAVERDPQPPQIYCLARPRKGRA